MRIAVALSIGVISGILAYVAMLFIRNRRLGLQARVALEQPPMKAAVENLRAVAVRTARAGSVSSTSAGQRRNLEVLLELPDLLDYLAVAVSAGETLYAALSKLSARADGQVAQALRRVCGRVELGETLTQALEQLSVEIRQPQVAELSTKLSLAMRRGTPVAQLLHDQASSVRAELRAQLLKSAGRNETRMLIPLIFLILPVTVLFATYPSLQLLQLSY